MAYLGPPPSQKLATPTSQYFSGNGSATAFTLNRPVNVAEDLNVFVNNVAQQPGSGKSYTATGTTLTFDAAPESGTNYVYVVYRGLAEPTKRLEHPSGQPISATTGTFSGDLTVDTTTLKVDSTNNRVGVGVAAPDAKLHVLDTAASTTTHAYTKLHLEDSDHLAMQFSGGTSGEQWIWFSDDTTATPVGGITYYHGGPYMGFRVEGTERLRIDSTGRVTTPNQPSCLVRMSNVSGIDATGQIALGNGYWQALSGGAFDNGSNFSTSTGRFTAPVTGYYHFTHHMRVDAANGSYLYTSILENSGDLVSRDLRSISTTYQTLHNSGNAYLAANDYLYVQFHVVGDSSVNIDGDSFFSCFLIG